MNLLPGQILAEKYRIIRQIGQGGMGAVFEGENVRIRRRVAIKTLHAAVSQKSDVIQRFEREAQAAGRIGSEHIVEVLDMGELPDQSRFMVMEFLEGQTLGERIVKQGRIPPRDVVPILDQLLEGLAGAHKAGIIHRDLKPANVFLSSGRGPNADFVKILDFGVSKFSILNNEEMSMTRTGAVMGTPYYMSPEQAKGARNVDHRADIYSVGVILYEAITGQVPFNAETFNELIFKIALESPPPPEQFVPNLDPQFSAIMKRAMAREVDVRFQSAEELRERLLAWAHGASPATSAGGGATVALAMPSGAAQGQGAFGTIALAGPPAAPAARAMSGGTVALGQAPTPSPGPVAYGAHATGNAALGGVPPAMGVGAPAMSAAAPNDLGAPRAPQKLGGTLAGTIAHVAARPSLAIMILLAFVGLLAGGGLYVAYALTRSPTKTAHSSSGESADETATTTARPTSAAAEATAEPTAAPSSTADAAPTASAVVVAGEPGASEPGGAAPPASTPRAGLTGRLPSAATAPTATGGAQTAKPTATAPGPAPTGRSIDDSL